jgi:hypothetical protein
MNPKSLEIENMIENLLMDKLNGEEMSEFRKLLEEFELAVFDDGKEAGIEEVRKNPGDYIEPMDRNDILARSKERGIW